MALTSNLHDPRPTPMCSATGKELAVDLFGDAVPSQMSPLPNGQWERWHKHADGSECRTIED